MGRSVFETFLDFHTSHHLGSNTHQNGGGSDGQTGDDGQGQPGKSHATSIWTFLNKARLGTDRSNLVQIRDRDENYPYPYEQTTFWKNVAVRWSPMEKVDTSIDREDLALYFASSGYYRFVLLCSIAQSLDHRCVDLVADDQQFVPK